MQENKSKKKRGRPKSQRTEKPKQDATTKNKVEWKGLPPLPLTKEEKAWIDSNLRKPMTSLNYELRQKTSEIHARTFQHKYSVPCACKSNVKLYTQWIAELVKLSDTQ